MNSDPDLVVLANKTRENINKRKEIAVEVEQKQSKVQRHGKERLEDENVGEESRSPLSVLVADLEEKLDASVARERKLEKELAELKKKYEHDSTILTKERKELSRLMNEIFARESKLKEVEISLSTVQEQLSHAGEKLDASKEKADIADITTSEAEEAGEEISLLGAQISHVKEKTDAFWKEKANHLTTLEEAKQGSSNTTLKLVSFLEEDNHDFICLDNPFESNSNEQGCESFQLSSKTLGEKDIINTITFWKMFYGTKR
ncbi:hypothetical protein RIF29_31080 [Crotalaria pallida]|uniref:Uncharacterized protein n=1 Tax=Crotalaria pallida TaxID=3830 RepID=A0AAN9HYL5_CROPI